MWPILPMHVAHITLLYPILGGHFIGFNLI